LAGLNLTKKIEIALTSCPFSSFTWSMQLLSILLYSTKYFYNNTFQYEVKRPLHSLVAWLH